MRHNLVNEGGHLTRPFLELLNLEGVSPVNRKTPIEKLDQLLQESWFRAGKLRSEIRDRQPTEEELALFARLGMTEPGLEDADDNYAGAIIPGGKITAVRKRLTWLIERWEQNADIDFIENEAGEKTIVFLGSSRPIGPDEIALLAKPMEGLPFREEWDPAGKTPRTEAEMMKLVFEQTRLPSDAEDEWTASVVSTEDISGRNANFADTLHAWIDTKPTDLEGGATWLLVSGQPFLNYHALVAEAVIVKEQCRDVKLQPIGYGINKQSPPNVGIFLDDIAKQVRTIAQLQGAK